MDDELKRPTLLGGATVVYDERGNAHPARYVEKAFAEAAQAMQDPRTRTLEQHAAHLGTLSDGGAGYIAKQVYMLDHGLEYSNGTLCYTPSTVHREAAWEAQQRLGQAERPLATSSGRVDGSSLAQQSHAPDKIFSRGDVLLVLKAIAASKGGLAEAINAFENLE